MYMYWLFIFIHIYLHICISIWKGGIFSRSIYVPIILKNIYFSLFIFIHVYIYIHVSYNSLCIIIDLMIIFIYLLFVCASCIFCFRFPLQGRVHVVLFSFSFPVTTILRMTEVTMMTRKKDKYCRKASVHLNLWIVSAAVAKYTTRVFLCCWYYHRFYPSSSCCLRKQRRVFLHWWPFLFAPYDDGPFSNDNLLLLLYSYPNRSKTPYADSCIPRESVRCHSKGSSARSGAVLVSRILREEPMFSFHVISRRVRASFCCRIFTRRRCWFLLFFWREWIWRCMVLSIAGSFFIDKRWYRTTETQVGDEEERNWYEVLFSISTRMIRFVFAARNHFFLVAPTA